MSTNHLYGKQEYKGAGSSFSTTDCEKLVYLKYRGIGLKEAYNNNKINLDQYKRFAMSGRAIVEQIKKNDPVGTQYVIYSKLSPQKRTEGSELNENADIYVDKLSRIETDIARLLGKFESQYLIESKDQYMSDLFRYANPNRKYQTMHQRNELELNMIDWIDKKLKGRDDGKEYACVNHVRRLKSRVDAYKHIVTKLDNRVKGYVHGYLNQKSGEYCTGHLEQQYVDQENVEKRSEDTIGVYQEEVNPAMSNSPESMNQQGSEVLMRIKESGSRVCNYFAQKYYVAKDLIYSTSTSAASALPKN